MKRRRLRSLSFAVPAPRRSVSVTVDGQVIPATSEQLEGRTVVTLEHDVVLAEGSLAEVRFG